MTLDELLGLARKVSTAGHVMPHASIRLALGLIDLLGEAQPCGQPEPELVENGFGERLVRIGGPFAVPPAELRALCAMWLRAADEAER